MRRFMVTYHLGVIHSSNLQLLVTRGCVFYTECKRTWLPMP
jgi:hypothetical protein